MGYETKLIIGVSMDHFVNEKETENYLSVIATIDLCKSDFVDTWMDKDTDTTKVFFYATDGNTKVKTDQYGSTLFEIEPKKVLRLMQDRNKAINYRRYNAAIPLLKSLIKDFKGENLKCILYGH